MAGKRVLIPYYLSHIVDHYLSFFGNKNQQTMAISKIVELCDTYSFDGIVVDTSYIGLTINRQQQVEFYKTLAASLKAKGKLIILVVPVMILF